MTIDLQQLISRKRAAMTPAQATDDGGYLTVRKGE